MYRKKPIWQYLLPVVISIAITHNVEVQAQWPQAFPYPSDFPTYPLPSGQTIQQFGAGDETGPFQAIYTYFTVGHGVGHTFPIKNQIIYEFQEFTTASGVHCRSQHRWEFDDFPKQAQVSLASHEGFKEFLIETPAIEMNAYGNTIASISHTDYDWDYQTVGLQKPIVDTLNTKYASRLQSFSEFSISETQSSKVTRQFNSRYPLLLPREEELFLCFFDFFPPTDSWSVNRKYKTSAWVGPEQNQIVTNLYPNSGGGGGVDIPAFNPLPAPELSHYYGLEIFSPNSAYAYLLYLFQSTPWNITPWFNQ